MESAAAAGGDPCMLPEAEARLLVDAERLSEAVRSKESELKKNHLTEINAFLLVRPLRVAMMLVATASETLVLSCGKRMGTYCSFCRRCDASEGIPEFSVLHSGRYEGCVATQASKPDAHTLEECEYTHKEDTSRGVQERCGPPLALARARHPAQRAHPEP